MPDTRLSNALGTFGSDAQLLHPEAAPRPAARLEQKEENPSLNEAIKQLELSHAAGRSVSGSECFGKQTPLQLNIYSEAHTDRNAHMCAPKTPSGVLQSGTKCKSHQLETTPKFMDGHGVLK